jgi:soluble P-type ATPase
MISIFQPSLIAIDKLMKKQIIGTLNKNLEVDKVVLVGGFGDSPALRKFLMHGVAEINNKYTTSIQLVMAPP